MNIAVPLSKNYVCFAENVIVVGVKRAVGESVVFERTWHLLDRGWF